MRTFFFRGLPVVLVLAICVLVGNAFVSWDEEVTPAEFAMLVVTIAGFTLVPLWLGRKIEARTRTLSLIQQVAQNAWTLFGEMHDDLEKGVDDGIAFIDVSQRRLFLRRLTRIRNLLHMVESTVGELQSGNGAATEIATLQQIIVDYRKKVTARMVIAEWTPTAEELSHSRAAFVAFGTALVRLVRLL